MKFVLEMVKNVVEKEKMLATSILSFSHNVFKMPLSQGCIKSGLCGKELKDIGFFHKGLMKTVFG